MSDLFRPGTIIPSGYTLAVTTWENDADDYDINYIKGIADKELVNELLPVMWWFSHAAEDMCNENIQVEEILCRLWDCIGNGSITKKFFDKFLPGVEFPVIGDDEARDDWLDRLVTQDCYVDVMDFVREFLGYAVNFNDAHARVIQTIKIHYFDECYVVPELPRPSKIIDASWANRKATEEWKI